MKIMVVTAHTRWTPHWETELEIMQRHLDDGDEVIHLHCGGELMACDDNAYHHGKICDACTARRIAGLDTLTQRVISRPFLFLTARDREELRTMRKTWSSLEELQTFTIENFDIGFAVASSVISLLRETVIQPPDLGNLIPRFLVAALTMYRSVQHHLDKAPVDRVYVFNGRFAPCRAVLRACQSRRVPCFVHERGFSIHHYALFENTTPHDLRYMEKLIRDFWEAAPEPERTRIAEAFFIERSQGVMKSWHSFIKDQKPDLLPHNWDPKKQNIVIFNSSEDEFAAIGREWQNPLYRDQQDGLERILASLTPADANLHFYLRVHPNLRGVDNAQTRGIARLRSPYLTIIGPEEPISSYALLKNASKVLSFGSTIGIEAVYWGVPSILAGQCYYRNLGGTYNPSSHEELMRLLRSPLAPKDRLAALKYGYYLNAYGIPFRHFKATDVFEGVFRGVNLKVTTEPGGPFSVWRDRVSAMALRLRLLRRPYL